MLMQTHSMLKLSLRQCDTSFNLALVRVAHTLVVLYSSSNLHCERRLNHGVRATSPECRRQEESVRDGEAGALQVLFPTSAPAFFVLITVWWHLSAWLRQEMEYRVELFGKCVDTATPRRRGFRARAFLPRTWHTASLTLCVQAHFLVFREVC